MQCMCTWIILICQVGARDGCRASKIADVVAHEIAHVPITANVHHHQHQRKPDRSQEREFTDLNTSRWWGDLQEARNIISFEFAEEARIIRRVLRKLFSRISESSTKNIRPPQKISYPLKKSS